MKPCFKIIRRFLSTQDIEKVIKDNKCRFDGNIRRICIGGVGDGRCIADMEICDEHTDINKKLHVGLAATLIESFTTFGLLSHKKGANTNTTPIDLYIAFLQKPSLGEIVSVEADSLKVGKKIAFTTCVLTNKCNGGLIATGSITKSFVR